MKIVIDISGDIYKRLLPYKDVPIISNHSNFLPELTHAVANGVPLPKGHGDLIDVNKKITVPVYDEQYEEWEEKILTVREALNRWSDEGVTVKDVVILADKEQES